MKSQEEKREYHREWRKNHPEAIAAHQARYWAKKAELMKQTTEAMSETETEGKDHDRR